MQAVILAAGFGKRMGGERPKPLTPLFGIPLIEHNILKLKRKGIDSIIVVYHDPRIAEFIRKKYPEIKLAYNDAPERENGYSLYFAREFINENFYLLMADHYFSQEFFNSVEEGDKTTAFVSKFCDDPPEATKVKVENDKIVAIGKQLEEYDYFDTGFFLCTPEIFKEIEELASKQEKVKLAEVFQKIADKGELKFKVVDGYWIDVDTREELRRAEKYVRNSLSKSGDGIISKALNRKISTRITPFLLKYDFLTPNVVTILSTIIGLIPFFFMMKREFLIGGILTQLASIIDGCDGEIARIKGLQSRLGAVLDSLLDRYVDIFVIFGIFLPFSTSTEGKIAFFLAVTGTILISYISHLTGVRPRFITRDVRLFLIMLGGFLSLISHNLMLHTLTFIGILSHIGVLYTLLKFSSIEKNSKFSKIYPR